MIHLKTPHFAISIFLAGSALIAVMPAQAMMGEIHMHNDETHRHEHMLKHWEKRQTELKAKLHLSAAQESAWLTFLQDMKVPNKAFMQPVDREALATLSTPDRIEKMNTVHETNFGIMHAHIKKHADATRAFYNQLSIEQQKIFDAETLPEQSHWKGKRN